VYYCAYSGGVSGKHLISLLPIASEENYLGSKLCCHVQLHGHYSGGGGGGGEESPIILGGGDGGGEESPIVI